VRPALNGYPAAWFSPTYKMLAEAWRDFRRVLRPVTAQVNKQERRIELITGGSIEFWSLDRAATVRGRKYKEVVIDEAAMVTNLQEAWQEVIRPTLTDYRGGAWFLSTPKGINFFFQIFSWGMDEAKRDWMAWKMPTSSNPFISAEEIDAAKDELPEQVFSQEYLAEFIQNAGAVFRNIAANLTATLNAKPDQHQGHSIVIGGDWAQKNDFTVFSVVCVDCKEELELDRFNQIAWKMQRDRLSTLIAKWGVEEALLESNSIGNPNLEALRDERLPVRGFETTGQSKPPLIQSLALALERKEIKWLPIAVATNELMAYESKINSTTGHISYSAPKGGHDDTVIARALARKSALHPRKVEQGDAPLW
jgi:hypothetical protein